MSEQKNMDEERAYAEWRDSNQCYGFNGREAFVAGAQWQARASLPVGLPEISGIGRDADHPRALVLYLRAEPTDSDIRAIQEALRAASTVNAEQVQLAYSRRNRVYLAGPMTGYAEFNFPAFNAEAARLRATGLEVVNPAEHGIVDCAEWCDYLRYDIAQIARCESIHFLPGWQESKGARLEHSLAMSLGMPMTFADGAAPSLPAAGAEEVELVAWMNTLTGDTTSHPVAVMDWDDEHEPVQSLMTVAQHDRIVAAISAQQAGAVSVPRELAERLADPEAWLQDLRKSQSELRALLSRNGNGGGK